MKVVFLQKRGYLDKKQCILLFRALNKYRYINMLSLLCEQCSFAKF